MADGLVLFALGSSRPMGEAIATALGIPLGEHETRDFEDGEHKTRPLCSVRGADVYVLASLYGEPGASANDKLVRLLFFVNALKDAGARRVTALTPYLAYARKDWRSQARDPVNSRYAAQLFEAVGTDTVVTVDVHNVAAFQNAFRIRAENLEARPLIVDHFSTRIGPAPVSVVSPDVGGIKRAEALRRMLAEILQRPVGMAFLEKYRAHGEVSGEALVGDVAGHTVLIVDDLVASGTTLSRAARRCRAQGAERVYAAASHGLFVGEAPRLLDSELLDALAVSDSVPPWRLPSELAARLERLSLVPLLAQAIRRLHEDLPLTPLRESLPPWD